MLFAIHVQDSRTLAYPLSLNELIIKKVNRPNKAYLTQYKLHHMNGQHQKEGSILVHLILQL